MAFESKNSNEYILGTCRIHFFLLFLHGSKCCPQKSPNFKLYPISKILPIKERLISLGCRRLTKSLLKNEYTLLLTREYLDSVSGLRRSQGVYTPLCCFLPIVAIALISLGLKYAISNN